MKKFGKLNSRMTFKDVVSEGHGREFSWWEEIYQIGWMVGVLVIDADYNYSKEEISEMVRNKKIISLGVVVDVIGFDPKLLYELEKVEKIEMLGINFEYEDSQYPLEDYHYLFDFNSLKEGDTDFSKDVYKEAFSLLRKRLNKKKVLRDREQIIWFLNDNTHVVDEVVRTGYYMDNGVKDEYLDLLKELSSSHKSLALKFNQRQVKK